MKKSDFKIMVVDDEPDVAQTLTRVLGDITEYNIHCFTDPYPALQALLKEPFHAVITDVRMPKLDGFELIKRMRKEGLVFYFIVASAHKTMENITKARRAGANYLFFKPIDFTELVEAIDTLFTQQEQWEKRLAEVGGETA